MQESAVRWNTEDAGKIMCSEEKAVLISTDEMIAESTTCSKSAASGTGR